jgi:hypothetical protein
MTATKLTLSVDRSVIGDAKRLATSRHTSVSALFTRLLSALAASTERNPPALGPVTRKASGIVRLPQGRTDRELVEAALEDRYGARR